jgi:hypothetical protein
MSRPLSVGADGETTSGDVPLAFFAVVNRVLATIR